MPVESVLDHVLGSVRQQFLDHRPLGSEVTVDVDDRLVLVGRESAAPDLLVQLGLVPFLDALRGYQLRVEQLGNLLPFLAVLFNVL